MSDLLISVLNAVGGSSRAFVYAVVVVLTFIHSAVALGRSRQWYMLPVVFGLTAVAGFVLNPLADSHTFLDLKADLTSYEMLTGVCIVQFLLACASAKLGFRIDGRCDTDRGAVRLAAVSAIPPPFVVVAMLLLEQFWLSTSAGARPEAVGRAVGLATAGLLTAAGGLSMCLPPRWLAGPHAVLAGSLIAASVFVPLLQDPLPQSMATVDWESLRLLACLLPILSTLTVVGFGWSHRRHGGRLRPRP